MRGKHVIGILFSNVHDEQIPQLTEKRTIASVPFGGRYRMIDFPLSNMVNSGINKVGVITKSNFQSLMDHLGSGKAWDLSRKREGLFLLPPFGDYIQASNSRVEALASIMRFLASSQQDLVLLSDCDVICNIPYQEVIESHIRNQADITAIYTHGIIPEHMNKPTVYSFEADGKLCDMLIHPNITGPCNYGLNMYLIKRTLLIQLIEDCVSRNMYNFKRDLIQRNMLQYRFYGYKFNGYAKIIGSTKDYFAANQDLLNPEIKSQLFLPDRPIYTKVRDDMPARYGLGSDVNQSLIADGCVIDGTVQNCILFRGVKISKGAVLKNCVIMQDTNIGVNCNLEHEITDKDVTIQDNHTFIGSDTYPVFISKGSAI